MHCLPFGFSPHFTWFLKSSKILLTVRSFNLFKLFVVFGIEFLGRFIELKMLT